MHSSLTGETEVPGGGCMEYVQKLALLQCLRKQVLSQKDPIWWDLTEMRAETLTYILCSLTRKQSVQFSQHFLALMGVYANTELIWCISVSSSNNKYLFLIVCFCHLSSTFLCGFERASKLPLCCTPEKNKTKTMYQVNSTIELEQGHQKTAQKAELVTKLRLIWQSS